MWPPASSCTAGSASTPTWTAVTTPTGSLRSPGRRRNEDRDVTTSSFERAVRRVVPVDESARQAADERQLQLTKPPGALGRLESLGAQLSAIAGEAPPPPPTPAALVVFAADHGVHAQGVTPWPQDVTAQMVANIAAGGAAVSVLARQHGVTVRVVDVGVATDLDGIDGVTHRRVRPGTDDLATGPAMSLDDARRALDVGAEVATEAIAAGHRSLLTGEMGIANTTSAAALISVLCGTDATVVTGRGTGIDDATLARKVAVVRAAAQRAGGGTPLEVLADVGGLEIAALAGAIVGAAAHQVPVLVDGVIACAAALVATSLAPESGGYLIAGHRSTEPGATAALEALDLEPVLDLAMRLGEGTGAVSALPIVTSAALLLAEMATFDSAGVTRKDAGTARPPR
ncbi:MAG: nicotinate-nucleotide--dimethylbenzimidazole phosphoribosyltransferase [Acidimicrobiia bacterium]|nr:nicotinate-nucleotide--dimethylbenzimidazole phosphoribosyltransferase [Acidimicrobiia bacterium]